MNSFKGKIKDVSSHGNLSRVKISIQNLIDFNVLVVDTPETASYLKSGTEITVLFKETEVILNTNFSPSTSIQNRIRGHITEIEEGKLLSRVVVQTEIGEMVSILSTEIIHELDLKSNSDVLAMIKESEIILST